MYIQVFVKLELVLFPLVQATSALGLDCSQFIQADLFDLCQKYPKTDPKIEDVILLFSQFFN